MEIGFDVLWSELTLEPRTDSGIKTGISNDKTIITVAEHDLSMLDEDDIFDRLEDFLQKDDE